MLIVFIRLTPSRKVQSLLRIFMVVIFLWELVGTFALSFQCERPKPWDMARDRCYNQVFYFPKLAAYY